MATENKWGNPRAHQIRASYRGHKEVPRSAFFGQIRWTEQVSCQLDTANGDEVPADDIEARRTYKYTCGLIKAINVLSGSKSVFTLYVDGFSNVDLSIGNTKFEFDPDLEEPTVTLTFTSVGTRHEATHRTDDFAVLTFRDQAQMREYVLAVTTTPDPEKIRRGGYHSYSSPSNGDCGLWPLAAGVAVGVGFAG